MKTIVVVALSFRPQSQLDGHFQYNDLSHTQMFGAPAIGIGRRSAHASLSDGTSNTSVK